MVRLIDALTCSRLLTANNSPELCELKAHFGNNMSRRCNGAVTVTDRDDTVRSVFFHMNFTKLQGFP